MSKTVKILNGLIETSEDGRKGFAAAAGKVHSPELKAALTARAEACRSAATELQSLVAGYGKSPDEGGSIGGAIHRGWMSLRESVSSNDDLAILEEVERGEDVAKAAYHKAIESGDLDPTALAVVRKQYSGTLESHDRVRDLRDRLRAAA